MACSGGGVLGFAPPPLKSRRKSAARGYDDAPFCLCSSSSAAVEETCTKFTYSRASPSVRWPHMKFDAAQYVSDRKLLGSEVKDDNGTENEPAYSNGEHECKVFDEMRGRNRTKKMSKLELKRDKDWRSRVRLLTGRILGLKSDEFVADILDKRLVQMTPTDFCFLVKWVGESSWQRALEVFEWLNLRHWYSPNARMVATILPVLGKANQEALAVEIFTRAAPSIGDTVQVYNAMMGVYARNGNFPEVQKLLHLMRGKGCQPDLVSFNTLINARLRSGPMTPDLGIELLSEVRRSKIRPDVITYNTILSGCARDSNLEEATKVFHDMQKHKCQPDLWTYNAMISVYGRCGLPGEAERFFLELGSKGFSPDAVTYNSLVNAFAKGNNEMKVNDICQEMVEMGFAKDEMTYNTIISMYGKQGKLDLALQVYNDMKSSGRNPDAVTYTVLIDSLGKGNKMREAANLMSEMLNNDIRPTLRTYSALICGYAKAGQPVEAEEIFNCMIRAGIRPDNFSYSVMLDVHICSNKVNEAMLLYQKMVKDGFVPDLGLSEKLLRMLGEANSEHHVLEVIEHLKELHGLSAETIPVILARSGLHDFASKALKQNVMQSLSFDRENLISIVASYSQAGNHSESIELLDFIQNHVSGSRQYIAEALVVLYCKTLQIDAALEEYCRNLHFSRCCSAVYESLIIICLRNERFSEACQIFSDMQFRGVEPSAEVYKTMALVYCKLGLPETAMHMVDQAEVKRIPISDTSIFSSLVEAFGKLKAFGKAESFIGRLRKKSRILNLNIWNSLLQAYAENGCYEKARAAFGTMMRDGPLPSVDSINCLLKALIVDRRLDELYVAVEDLQDMGFKISKGSITLMLEAFAESGNVFDVKKIYRGMKAAGYLPTMHLYKVILCLLCKAKQVKDVEAVLLEMETFGFKPDLSVYNSVLKLYTKIEDYRKAALVYRRLQESGVKPDEDTYTTLILMYCRDCRPEEAASILREMTLLGLKPDLDTFKSLTASYGKKLMVREAEELFAYLKSDGRKLDRSFYHLMMKMYRSSGHHDKAEKLLITMQDSGVEPNAATMRILMTSYASSGHPVEAEKIFDNLKSNGASISTLEYSSVIDAYLKNGDLDSGIRRLMEIRNVAGFDPDHRIWTCFIRAAKTSPTSLLPEIDCYLQELGPLDDDAAFNFVNALEDLLWAFERRATAVRIFQLAMKRSIYNHHVFRVAEKDWGADFRKLSAGAALTGLTLWLDHMQDASLQGFPESPKSVVLITGAAEYNGVSLNSTLKAFLWEMGSPFLPCKTRTGILVAKAHSLRMWLKDSPFCLDLELRDRSGIPEMNSMTIIGGCCIRRELAPAFTEIREKLGDEVGPRKFARLALLSGERRAGAIQADIDGRREKLAKLSRVGGLLNKTRIRRTHKISRNLHHLVNV
ncbi:hypothetical protein M569_06665 [Genlisea aurea]|uniref:Pentacotripeptide-repeat region of PRORP domain-containing protein n=1 Tax=Genlisea aurea TaxID=192259 RepID=S8E6R7_9LAMI|nr:hypothetical protein M569_06665 [Genlisea aurea]